MVEKFNKELIIYYSRNRFVNVRKRVIKKLYDNRYVVETYYRDGKIDKFYRSHTVFNSEQIEELIKTFLNEFEFECEKTVIYN